LSQLEVFGVLGFGVVNAGKEAFGARFGAAILLT
jgi:hypothetical protein